MPMSTRPACRVWRAGPLKNSTPPPSSSTGTSRLRSNDRICTTRAEPKSAPSISASPVGTLSTPLPAKPAASTATAVELCSSTAIPAPTPAARSRPEPLSRSTRRSAGSWLRSIPVRTMRTAHNSSVTDPARWSRSR